MYIYIYRISDPKMESKGMWQFRISNDDMSADNKRILFVDTEDERDAWVAALQSASTVIPMEDRYDLREAIGMVVVF